MSSGVWFSSFFGRISHLLYLFLVLWLSFPLSQAIAITDVPSGANESPCLEALDSPSGFGGGKNERPNKRRPKKASDPGPTLQGKNNNNKEMKTRAIMTTTTTTTKSKDGECRSAIEEVSSAAQGTKNGIEDSKGHDEKEESVRTSGCDKINVSEMRVDCKEAEEAKNDKVAQPQQLSPPLRSAEDAREVGSRVDVFNKIHFLYSKLCILYFSLIHIASSYFY